MGSGQHIRPVGTRHVPAEVTTMRAIIQDSYGEAEDVLRLEEIDRPRIADDEVLLQVHAAGVDRGVCTS